MFKSMLLLYLAYLLTVGVSAIPTNTQPSRSRPDQPSAHQAIPAANLLDDVKQGMANIGRSFAGLDGGFPTDLQRQNDPNTGIQRSAYELPQPNPASSETALKPHPNNQPSALHKLSRGVKRGMYEIGKSLSGFDGANLAADAVYQNQPSASADIASAVHNGMIAMGRALTGLEKYQLPYAQAYSIKDLNRDLKKVGASISGMGNAVPRAYIKQKANSVIDAWKTLGGRVNAAKEYIYGPKGRKLSDELSKAVEESSKDLEKLQNKIEASVLKQALPQKVEIQHLENEKNPASLAAKVSGLLGKVEVKNRGIKKRKLLAAGKGGKSRLKARKNEEESVPLDAHYDNWNL